MVSGEVWRDAWSSANNGFEQLLYETKKTAHRPSNVGTLSCGGSPPSPNLLPNGPGSLTVSSRSSSGGGFLSSISVGIGRRQGACPACKRQFVGYKNQMVCCASWGNIICQPQGNLNSRGRGGGTPSKSEPEIIDVEFEEK